MKVWLRKTLKLSGIVLILLALAIWGLKYLLFDRAPAIPPVADLDFDLSEIRTLALTPEGSLPLRLNLLEIAEAPFLRTVVFAGGGFEEHPLYFSTLQLVYDDYTILIDPVHPRDVHDLYFPGGAYNDAAYDTMRAALREAELILATHEHADHVGGLTDTLLPKQTQEHVRLTVEQISTLQAEAEAATEEEPSLFTPAFLKTFTPLAYERYYAVAPGVVLIKAPGHTPGSQMMYLRLQTGTEFLIVGDIAWHMDNITQLIGRPWIANLFGDEDRTALAHQLRLLHDLHTQADLHLLVAHDKDQHDAYIAQGLIRAQFE